VPTIKINPGKELAPLLKRTGTEKPDPADRQALVAYLKEHGTAEFARVGDLAESITSVIIDSTFKSDFGLAYAIGARCNQIKTELGYEESSPLERLLIQHVIVCWLRLHDCEFNFEAMRSTPSFAQGLYWEKKLSEHQRRYLRAVEALARVRRLLYKPSNNVAFNFLLKQQLGGG